MARLPRAYLYYSQQVRSLKFIQLFPFCDLDHFFCAHSWCTAGTIPHLPTCMSSMPKHENLCMPCNHHLSFPFLRVSSRSATSCLSCVLLCFLFSRSDRCTHASLSPPPDDAIVLHECCVSSAAVLVSTHLG